MPEAATHHRARPTQTIATHGAEVVCEIAGGPVELAGGLLLPVADVLPDVADHVERPPIRNAARGAARTARQRSHPGVGFARRPVVGRPGCRTLPLLVRHEALARQRARLFRLKPADAGTGQHAWNGSGIHRSGPVAVDGEARRIRRLARGSDAAELNRPGAELCQGSLAELDLPDERRVRGRDLPDARLVLVDARRAHLDGVW